MVKTKLKKALSVLLSVLMVLSCWVWGTPDEHTHANAATTSYKWKVTVNVSGDGTKHTKDGKVTIYWKNNNGIGDTGSYQLYSGSGDNGIWKNTGNYTYTSDSFPNAVPAGAFPYKATAYVKSGSQVGSSKLNWKVKVEVLDQNGNLLYDFGWGNEEKHTISWSTNNDENTSTHEITSDKYPYVSNISTSPDSVIIGADGNAVTKDVTLSAVDQYGVDWVNAPTSVTALGSAKVNSTSGATTNVTCSNALADYNAISATYSCAAGDYSVSGLPVKVTRQISFDNYFDYEHWRRAGIDGMNVTVSDVTDTGFKVASTRTTDGSDDYTYFNYIIPLAPGDYTLLADAKDAGGNYSMFVAWYLADTVYTSIDALWANMKDTASSKFESSVTNPSIDFTVPEDCAFISVRVDPPTNSSVRVDNFRIVKRDYPLDEIELNPITMDISYGDKFSAYNGKVPMPTRDGYHFTGWSWQGNLCYDASCNWVLADSPDYDVKSYSDALGYNVVLDSNWEAHNYSWVEEVPATCVSTGTMAHYECTVCHMNFDADKNELSDITIAVDANNHILNTTQAKTPTCTDIGWTEYVTCQRSGCTYTTYKEISATGHKDTDKNHVCDNGCDVYQGTHADSATDNDHVCDYGCGEVLEKCSDVTGDKNHNCDICDKADVTEHTYSDATCTVAKTCTECSATEGVAQGHSFINYESDNNATCTADGTKTAKCDRCDETDTVTDEDSKRGHLWSETFTSNGNGKDATHYQTCTRENCGVKNDAVAHNWNAGEVTKAPGCTTEGEKTFTCTATGCGATYTEAVEQNGHTNAAAVEEKRTEASCTTDGKYDSVVYCSVCKTEISRVTVTIPATGHKFSDITAANAATCIATGNEAYKSCTVCNKFFAAEAETDSTDAKDSADAFKTEIDSANHETTTDHEKTDATCLTVGYTAGTFCEDCDKWISGHEEIEVIGHKNKEHHTKVDATCIATGTIEYWSCPDCDKNFSDVDCTQEVTDLTIKIDPDNHNLKTTEAKAPTCTEIGWNEYVTCQREGCNHTTYVEKKALGHSYDYTNGTDNKNGTHTVTCTVCAEGTEGHTEEVKCTYGEGVVTEPTCTKSGFTTHTCTVCSYSYTDAETEASGHEFGDWKDNNDGTHTRECTVCTDEEGRTEIADCIYGEWNETKAPTCTEKGEKERTCSLCGYVEKADVPALNHIDENNNGYCDREDCGALICDHAGQETVLKNDKKATCEDDGYTGDKHCKKCDVIVEYGTKINKLGHDWDETKSEENLTRPTENADGTWKDGYYTYTCKNDSNHTTTEAVKRADYSDYDKAVKALEDRLTDDTLLEFAENEITAAINSNKVNDNLIASEQETVTDAAENLQLIVEKYSLKYTVTYKNDDLTVLKEIEVVYGSSFETLESATKDATAEYTYTFDKWDEYVDIATGDITYTATYTATKNSYTVTWKNDDGTTIDTTTVEYGTVPTHADATKANTAEYTYTFAGWTPEVVAVTGDAEYTATFTATKNSYTVTWVVDGVETKEEYEYGETPSFKDSTDKAATAEYTYTFAGWTPEVVAVTGDAEYTATYTETANEYTLTVNTVYVDNVDSTENTTESTKYAYGTAYSVAAPEKEGYTLTTEGTLSGTMPASDVTVTLTYTANTYTVTVTYTSDDGKINETKTETLTYGESYNVATPEKTGYTADKVAVSGTVTGDVNETVTYTANKYNLTVKYVYEDGSEAAETYTSTVVYDTAYSVASPVITGYTADVETVTGTMGAENVTVTVTYAINVYNVTFVDFNGTQIGEVQKVNYLAAATAPAAPVREGYTFTGWDKSFDSITEDITVTARYTINQYTITFDTDGGNAIDAITQDYGTAVTAPAAPTKTGYTFAGWDKEIPGTMPASDVTIKAQWTINSYTVKFVDNAGNETEKQYNYGTAASDIEVPENTANVYNDYGHFSYSWPTISDVTDDVTYTEIETKTEHNYKDVVTEPTCDDKGFTTHTCQDENCNYSYVDTYTDAKGHDYDMTKSEANLTRPELVDGEWTDGKYTFTCKNDPSHTTEEVVKRADYTAFEEAQKKLSELLETDLTEEAKQNIQDVLDKYEDMADDLIETEQSTLDNAVTEITETFNDNVSALKTYTVTFVVNGETVKTETVVSGKGATAPADPEKAYDENNHYAFANWDNAFTNVTSDITVTAVFTATAHSYTAHTDKNDDVHTDKCACGYEKDVEHSYDAGVVTLAPTCSAKGEKLYTCSLCSGEKTEVMEEVEDAHKWKTQYTVDSKASCEKEGQKSYHCEYCDTINTESIVVIAQRTHNIVDTTEAKEATCIETGIMNQKCDHEGTEEYEACTYTTTREIPVNADNHTGTEQLVNYKAATCTEDGYTGDMQWACCKVIAEYGEKIPMLGHKDENKDHVCDNNCGVYQGEHKDSADDNDHVCDYGCGEELEECSDVTGDGNHNCDICDKADVTAHTFSEATCTVPATCTECDVTDGEELGHEFTVYVETIDYTCTTDGYDIYKCLRCEETEHQNITKAAHRPEADYTVIEKATCESDGYKAILCSECKDELETATIEKRAHVFADNGVKSEATCTEEGVMNTICSNVETDTHKACSYESTRVIPVDKDAHKWETEYTVDSKASCDKEGQKSYHCEYCDVINEASKTVIAKREHNLVDTTVALEPTCSATGVMNQKCDCAETAEYEVCDYTTTRVMDKVAAAHKAEAEYTVMQKATCEADGYKAILCEYCDAELSTQTIAKREHNLVDTTVALEPTCSATGIMNQKCDCAETAEYEACDYTTTRVIEIEADAHKWETEYTVDSKASCDKEGQKSYHCEYCDTINTESIVVIAQRAHNLVDTTVALAPTCSATGIMNQKCDCAETAEYEACDYTTTRVIAIDPDAHKAEEDYTVIEKATCEADGYKAILCEYCDAELETATIEKRAHVFADNGVKSEATCTEEGVMNTICTNAETDTHKACSHESTRVIEIDADAHTGEADVVKNNKDATCTEEGYTGDIYWSCCDKLETEGTVIGAHGHNYVGVITKEATCTEKGVKTFTCTYDKKHTYTEEIALKAHTIVKVDEKSPSCEAIGWNAYEYCSACDTYNTYSEIPATGHAYDNGVITTEPTCEGKGVKTFTCQNDVSHTYTEDVKATGHNYDNGVITTEPTCEGKGVKTYTCQNDASHTYNEDVASTGHEFIKTKSEENLTRPAMKADGTWTDGYYTYTCKKDSTHTTTEKVSRADYSEYDKLTGTADKILSLDIPAEDKEKLQEALSNNDIPGNLIVSEQDKVDAVLDDLRNVISEVYPDAGLTLVIKGNSTFYAGTVLDLKAHKVNEVVDIEATDVTWVSSDDNIVFFSNGKLFAVGTGTVTLTATTGLLKASKTVTIVEGGNARRLNFTAIDNMHFIVEDYFAIFNGANLYWSDDYTIRFRVYTYQSFPFETYIVYVNGQPVEPDADGYYTVPKNAGDIRVTISGAVYDDDGTGNTSKFNFWEWLLALLRKIVNFFKNLFGIA